MSGVTVVARDQVNKEAKRTEKTHTKKVEWVSELKREREAKKSVELKWKRGEDKLFPLPPNYKGIKRAR